MKRKCQINAILPVTCFQVPIVGNTELELTTEEIYKCLCAKAEVTEILEDGTMMCLDFTNYNNVESNNQVEEDNVDNTTSQTADDNNLEESTEQLEEDNTEEVEESTEQLEEESIDNEVEDLDEVEEVSNTVEEENPTKYDIPSSRNNNKKYNNNKRKNKK